VFDLHYEQIGGKQIIRKVEGACLAGRLPWMHDEQPPVLQVIRANNNFCKKSWFDVVAIRRFSKLGALEIAYAELRFLFEADVSTAGKLYVDLVCLN
jgi:hypothetical protein